MTFAAFLFGFKAWQPLATSGWLAIPGKKPASEWSPSKCRGHGYHLIFFWVCQSVSPRPPGPLSMESPPSDMTQVFWMIWAMNVCMCVSVVLLFRVHIPFPVVLRHLMELSSFNQNGKAKETKVLRREWLSSHVPEEVTTNLVTVPTPLG